MLTKELYAVLISFRSGSVSRHDGPTAEINWLVDHDYLRPTEHDVRPGLSIRPVKWELTVDGRAALSKFEEECKKQAKEERQRRFQNKISVLSVLVPLVTFILGLVVERFTGIIGIVSQLLG